MRYYKIILGDSRQMPEVQSNTVQMIVTSPPYGTLDVFTKDENEKGAEFDLSRYHNLKTFFQEIAKTWKECERVLKPGGVLICEWEDYPVGSRYFGYPREICLCGPMVESIEKSGLGLISRWFVRKFEAGVALEKFQYTMYSNLRSATPRAIANVAYAFAFIKKEYKPSPHKLDFKREDWGIWSDGVWNISFMGSGLDISGGATFPIEFAKRCLKIYSNPGDLILEPFLGTGTTMKAAFELGRSCVGYEVLERMLPTIKAKTQYGTQDIYEPISWEVVNRYEHRETVSIQEEEQSKS
jgi:DNA modification methylase